jgi:hypothetical protein
MRISSLILVAGFAGVVAGTAGAAEDEGGWQWYYSAGIPITDVESSELADAAAAEGIEVSGEARDTTIGGQGTLGVMMSRNFGIELRYSASGSARDAPSVTNAGPTPIRGNTKVALDGFTLSAVSRWPLSERIDLLAKLGYGTQDIEIDASLPVAPSDPRTPRVELSESDDDDGFVGALGVRLQTGERWALTAEIEYLAIDFDGMLDEPLRGSVNFEYEF